MAVDDSRKESERLIEITIPAGLYEEVELRIKGTDFGSVSDYVAFVLREFLVEGPETDGETYERDGEDLVRERLRSLGYLD